MKSFQAKFQYHVSSRPDALALRNSQNSISYSQLAREIELIALQLKKQKPSCIALAMSNSPAWIAFDLAAAFTKIPIVPVPHFFSVSQVQHLIENAGVDMIITDQYLAANPVFKTIEYSSDNSMTVFGQDYSFSNVKGILSRKELPVDTLKISYTSGTTGQPKGVIISASQVDKVINSLVNNLNASPTDRHLSALPFSLLLENIAGIYAVLAAGGQCIIPDFEELGLAGSSSLDVQKFIQTILIYNPTTMITVPALAQALVNSTEKLGIVHHSLRFIAVGGAPLSNSIIEKAQELGLPLFEGYGLTECSSVVALNTPDTNKTGSVGKPLPHIQVDISPSGEVLVNGALCGGYLNTGHDEDSDNWATGDLGYIDEDGFLFITGRKRTAYCTSFGRNISPEWVERELVCQPQINQALIYGEGKPFNLAIIVPSQDAADDELDIAIDSANQQLPDYAKIGQWVRAEEPYSTNNKQLSASGIIQRQQIQSDYQAVIANIYQSWSNHETQ